LHGKKGPEVRDNWKPWRLRLRKRFGKPLPQRQCRKSEFFRFLFFPPSLASGRRPPFVFRVNGIVRITWTSKSAAFEGTIASVSGDVGSRVVCVVNAAPMGEKDL
jgi:hypothetical protein